MNPKVFLRYGGILLIILGLLGIRGILGNISSASFFHPPSWINYFHFLLGIGILSLSYSKNKKIQRIVTGMGAGIATTIGILGLLLGRYAARRYDIPELADPSDHITHLIVGICALWAVKKKE